MKWYLRIPADRTQRPFVYSETEVRARGRALIDHHLQGPDDALYEIFWNGTLRQVPTVEWEIIPVK